MHDWHATAGAVFTHVGAWLRPEYYPVAGRDREAAILDEEAADVDRGQGRLGRAPRQDPIAELEAESLAEPPGGEPAATVELAVRPGGRPAHVVPEAERRAIGASPEGAVEEVEDRRRLWLVGAGSAIHRWPMVEGACTGGEPATKRR